MHNSSTDSNKQSELKNKNNINSNIDNMTQNSNDLDFSPVSPFNQSFSKSKLISKHRSIKHFSLIKSPNEISSIAALFKGPRKTINDRSPSFRIEGIKNYLKIGKEKVEGLLVDLKKHQLNNANILKGFSTQLKVNQYKNSK